MAQRKTVYLNQIGRAASPSLGMLNQIKQRLSGHAPFSEIPSEQLDCLLAGCSEAYFAPDEVIIQPQDGPPAHLFYVQKGTAVGRKGIADLSTAGFQYEAGEMFPVNAFLAKRSVTATYSAKEDLFCLLFTWEGVDALSRISPVFSDYLNRRTMQFLDLSRRAIQVAYSSQTLAEQSLEKPLADVARLEPFSCEGTTPVKQVLEVMKEHRIGSMVVVSLDRRVEGIVTRQDILSRVALAEKPLATPVEEVMTSPVHTLDLESTAQEAALLMSRHSVRHIPVTERGSLVGVVSERDLFAMQRLSLKQVGASIRAAQDTDMLKSAAADIRAFAKNLLAQGIRAKQLTELISHLNDVLLQRILQIVGNRKGIDSSSYCWLGFGSEGRAEQTIATDQDNGLVFSSDQPDLDRPRWLAFALEVNVLLDQCGFPLCKGNIMASNPDFCLTSQEWVQRFETWIEQATPESLRYNKVYFDMRPLEGNLDLARPIQLFVFERAQTSGNFLSLLAEQVVRFRPPLTWHGSIETTEVNGHRALDLKRSGTAVFIDAARYYSLAYGIQEVNTRKRFEGLASRLNVEEYRRDAWVSAFEFIQMMRLRIQLETGVGIPDATQLLNVVNFDNLNHIDKRILKECFRVGRRLQQRIEAEQPH